MILFANFIQAIGEQLKIRQQVIATATGKETFGEYFSLEWLKLEPIQKSDRSHVIEEHIIIVIVTR